MTVAPEPDQGAVQWEEGLDEEGWVRGRVWNSNWEPGSTAQQLYQKEDWCPVGQVVEPVVQQ